VELSEIKYTTGGLKWIKVEYSGLKCILKCNIVELCGMKWVKVDCRGKGIKWIKVV